MTVKKSVPLLVLFFIITGVTYAQLHADSVFQKIGSATHQLHADSSLKNHLLLLPETRLSSLRKLDSVGRTFNLAADSIQILHNHAVAKIDIETSKLNRTVDSLQRLQLPIGRYAKQLDSLNSLRQTAVTRFTSSFNALTRDTKDKLNDLDLPPEYKSSLQEFTKNINDFNPASKVGRIPELRIPGDQLSEIGGISELTSKTNEIGKINNIAKLPDIETPIGDYARVTQRVQAYQQDFAKNTEGNLQDIEKLPEAIEQQATKIEGIDELQRQSGFIDERKAQIDAFNDPGEAKKKAVAMGKKAAVDHFAGKQEQLKAAMEKLSKYKQKYSAVSSIKDLPKRPSNPMKSRPFIERLVPGLYLQYQQKNFYLVDVSPYIGYKITARLTTGLGWNHRYAYDKKHRTFDTRSRIFGPRAFVDFKLGKGFIAHLEGESMNSFVPSTLRGNPDAGQRGWVRSFMTGIKKEYRIYKNLKGTALIQYNLFNRYYKAPYVDRLNSRIGFEYVLKKQNRVKRRI